MSLERIFVHSHSKISFLTKEILEMKHEKIESQWIDLEIYSIKKKMVKKIMDLLSDTKSNP